MIGIYDKNDILITNLVDTAFSYPDILEVKSRTLDGQWHIQTIGVGATVLSVKANLRLEEKNIMDVIKRNTDLFKVIFDGKYYIGVLDGKLDYDRQKFAEYPMFGTSFNMLVREEGTA
jgi:hypothetical protein